CRRQSVSTGLRSRRWERLSPCEDRAPPPQVSRPSSRSLHSADGDQRTGATEMVSSGAAPHLLASHPLSSPVLHRPAARRNSRLPYAICDRQITRQYSRPCDASSREKRPRVASSSLGPHRCRERIPANVVLLPPLWAVEMWRVTNRGQRTLRLSADSLPRLLTT